MEMISTVVHSLPRQTTSFIGREQEIADIIMLLDNPDCQLLTLVGPGGIGKTRLALEVARRKLDAFADGVWFVNLAPLTAPDQLPATIAHMLQISPRPDNQSSLKQNLLDFLRNRQLLLVLDNFEHLLEGVELVSEMLLAAPEIKILVTSRAVLNMQAEWVQPVQGMRYPEHTRDNDLDEFSAVKLFAERGRQLQPDFDLDAVGDCVVQVCQLVDGVPLGIELAAAWLRTLPCETIAEQIQRGLDFLTSDQRDVPERHRSMRAVFNHTWKLLTDEEQGTFQRFSVFRGGCTLEGAEAVTDATLAVLDSLVEKSLLTLDSRGRYQTHELLRQYGEEKLQANDGAMDVARDAHSTYFACLMARLNPKIKGENQSEALNTIEPDFENVRAAWLWALERRNYEVIDEMLEALDLFCQARTRFDDSGALFAQAWEKLAPADDEVPHRVWGRVLARSSMNFQEEYEAVRRRRERALAVARQFDDPMEIASCLYWLGATCNDLHDFPSTIGYLEESLALLRILGERFWQARVLNELGICHLRMDLPTEAIPYSQAALDLRREIDDRVGVGWCLHDLGMAQYILGQLDWAERYWQASLREFRDIGSFFGETGILAHFSDMTLLNGEFERLLSLNEIVLSKYAESGFSAYWGWFHMMPGLVAGLNGDYEQCQGRCESLRSSGNYYIHFGLAVAACGLQNWADASDHLKDLLKGDPLGRVYGDLMDWRQVCLPLAALVLAHEGEAEQAAVLLGLTFSFPPHFIGWVKRWGLIADLADDLEKRLGAEAYTAAWNRGQKLDLDDVITSLRMRFGVGVDVQQQTNAALEEPLTARELEVLNLIYAGHTNREIADQLVLAESTVKRHINHIYSKLAVENRTQALARARALGLHD